MDFKDYLDAAKTRMNTRLDADVCRALKVTTATMASWKQGHVIPRPDHIVELAELGGLDPTRALCDHGMWKSEGKTRELYSSLRSLVASIALLAVTWPTTDYFAHQLQVKGFPAPTVTQLAKGVAHFFTGGLLALLILVMGNQNAQATTHLANKTGAIYTLCDN